MDRNREGRRGSMAAVNGLSRRRHRSSSLRDSPEEDGAVELQETARLRDRVNKKDRDRDRSGRNKRRRGDRLMHGNNREEAGDDSTEDSIDEEEEDEDEDSGVLRMLPPNPTSSSSLLYHHHQRKSFPPAKIVRAAPTWKVADEMIGVSVPRKARSASGKRSHECWMSSSVTGGGGAEQIHRQASTSPARPNATVPSMAPLSPSSSNVSVRKKMKPIGPKHRPPKMSKSSSSSMQEDIEIEVAEVLYGLMKQSQCPPKQEVLANASQKLDCKDTNGSSNEVRSRVSSPISISPPAAGHQLSVLPQNSSTSTTSLPVLVPKRKKPRPVKLEEESPAVVAGRNGSISSTPAKVENEQHAKLETSSPKSEKNSGSDSQNARASADLGSSLTAAAVFSLEPPRSESVKAESNTVSDLKPLTEEPETREGVQIREEVPSPKKESAPCTKLDIDLADATAPKKVSTDAEVECKREEKFKIDLMAPPPPLKSSPEGDGDTEYVSDSKSIAIEVEMVPKAEAPAMAKEKMEKIPTQDAGEIRLEDKKTEQLVDESESQKPLANEERIFNLQLDLEKPHKDSGTGSVSESKLQQPQLSQFQKQQQQQTKTSRNDPKTEKTAQPTSLPMPMNLAGWPGGLPSVGYMPPLQAVLSMDGSTGSSTAVQPPHPPHSHPRPKRCATHYHIARTIYYYQQFTTFWPAATGSASMYGPKPYNLNVVPATESMILGHPLQGSSAGRSLNSVQDKVQVSSTISGQNVKDKSSATAAANLMDATQRKQLVLQQATQPAGAGNLLHGPAFIFPMSQQQAAAAAASRSTTVKSFVATGNVALPGTANSGPLAPVSSSSPAAGTATTVSFNYPNLPANEPQYLAILQNNGYPFSIPAHVGSPPPYRGGSPAQAMPFFNGPFFPPQMMQQAQLQQQAQAQAQAQALPHSQPQTVQQGRHNTSTSSGSSSSQKHQQAQQQQLQGGGNNGGGGSSNNFPATKNRLPVQQQQQNHPIAAPNKSRRHEGDVGGEDSPSTADSRVSHAHKSIYGQNFTVPIHPHNFALMSPAALGGVTGSHGEQQQQQQQSLKGQAYAMSFASFNGAATQGLDFSSMAQNHAICLPDARHGYHIAAAAATQAAQQKKNHQIPEERKTGGDSINSEEERKGTTGKATAGVGQSLAFYRPDSTDLNVSTVLGNSVIDGCARTLNLSSALVNANRAGRPTTSTSTVTTAAPISSSSTQHQQQQQQQQLIQLQQQRQMQQQFAAAVSARSKAPTSSNASVYSDCLPSSSSMASKYPNAPSVFPQAFIQSSSPAQSPQWKNSARTTGSAVSSPISTSSQKNLPQQQSRIHHGHTHISFGVNTKQATASQGQQLPMNNQSSSPPTVGSPPTSSISKGAGGSPRTGSSGGKSGSSPAPPSQQPKSSQSGQSRKSSPVGGRNVSSILGNSNMSTAPSYCGKSQSQVQLQHLQKPTLQQPQLYFTNACIQQAPLPQSTTATTTCMTGGHYQQRRQNDQQQQGASAVPSSGMLSLCSPSLTLAGVGTSDPAKAVAAAAAAAAANSMKGGMPSSGLLHAAQYATQTAGNSRQLMSAAFPCIHTVPTVSVKPAEQKQPAGE